MKTLVIGDIHACYAEMLELLDKAGLSGDDEVIAVGDIVDRGPDNVRVLDYFMNNENAYSVMGNHERKHVRSYNGIIKPALSQVIAREEIGMEQYPAAIRFMEDFPLYIELPEALVLHGFLEPDVPLEDQHEAMLSGVMTGEMKLREYDEPWYNYYDGEKPLIVGHLDYRRDGQPLVVNDLVYCIDTGCCRGGALTGVLLPEFRIISVKSATNYWMLTKDSYRDLAIAGKSEERLTWKEMKRKSRVLRRAAEKGSASAAEDREKLDAKLELAQQACEAILEHVKAICEEVLAGLAEELDWDNMSPSEQGSIFHQRYGERPESRMLHRCRRGNLQLDDVKHSFKTPHEAIGYACENGLIDGLIDDE